jgi:hypothetical protein
MIRNTAKISMLALVLFTSALQVSTADTTAGPTLKQMVNQVKTACRSDIQKYCSDVRPGNGRIEACLNSREDKLSYDCRTTKESAEESISQRGQKAELAFRSACGSDVQKFCTNVPYGNGRVLDCLSKNEDEVSYTCRQAQADLSDQLAEFLG